MARRRLRRLVTRGRVKWVAIVAVGALTLVLGASVLVTARLGMPCQNGRGDLSVLLIAGGVRLVRMEDVPASIMLEDPEITFHRLANPGVGLWWRWIPNPQGWHLHIPGWPLVVLLALPTAWLWHTDRRAKPWQCAMCRYDLRGLDGGVCPECGEVKEGGA